MDTFHAKKNDPVELTKMITFMNNQIEECRDSVAAMTISSDHLKDIVDTVLTVSMLEDESNRLQIVKFNPHQVIQMIAIMFKATVAEKKLTLLTKTDQSSVQHFNVMGDLYRFKEVIINLVSNAIKFTEEGTITISIGIESIKDDQVTLLIQVQDTGIGIKKDEISKLFQKFSQANSQTFEKYGGSGLGLKISKEIVQLMGGTPLQIKSVYGKGSTFYFSVPFKMCTPTDDGNNGGGQLPSPRGVTLLSNPVRTSKIAMSKHQLFDSFEKNEKTRQSSVSSPSSLIGGGHATTSTSSLSQVVNNSAQQHQSDAPPGGYKILVVEDNKINQKLLCRVLSTASYEFDVADNGAECVQSIRHNKYSMILMDIEMPVMGGIEATQKIRQMEDERNIPVQDRIVIIGVSANSRKESINLAMSAGMQGYITKPYMKNDILGVIHKWDHGGGQ
ncbi:hypothetical protein AKO1_006655 [Acrasis kona]|uniref:Histidine kinase n=1 Tax=Acrasis kona TaxID=1008807 RepID=A0AAW2ZLF7_9EUKA